MDIVAEDFAVAVTFDDGSEEKIIRPQYSRTYYMEPAPKKEAPKIENKNDIPLGVAVGGWADQLKRISELAERFNPPVLAKVKVVRGTIKTNRAYCPLKFLVVNQGRSPIDDYKLFFKFDNENVKFVKDNVEKKMSFPEISFAGVSNIYLEDGLGITMYGTSIIPGDNSSSDDFFVHLPYDVQEVGITWKLLSRYFSCEGKLKVVVEKEWVEDVKYDKEKVGETYIGDYIEMEEIVD